VPKTIFFGLRVSAAVVSAEGKLTHHSLQNARDKVVEKRRLFLDFGSAEKHTIRVFDTEDKLAAYLQSDTAPSMTIGRIRLPRLIYEPLYWPPTPGALLKVREIQQQGRTPTFEEIEGADLSRAWDFLSHPEHLEEIRDDLVGFKIYP